MFEGASEPDGNGAPEEPERDQIIEDIVSSFTVVLEFIEIVLPAEEAGAANERSSLVRIRMSKIYDKIILMVALLILAGGLAIYFTGGAEAERSAPPMGGGSYEPRLRHDTRGTGSILAGTRAAGRKSLGAVRSFHPAEDLPDLRWSIRLRAASRSHRYRGDRLPVYLVRLEREPYRIQLEGYIEDDLADASKSLLLFYDEEQGKSVRARVGAEKPEHESQGARLRDRPQPGCRQQRHHHRGGDLATTRAPTTRSS